MLTRGRMAFGLAVILGGALLIVQAGAARATIDEARREEQAGKDLLRQAQASGAATDYQAAIARLETAQRLYDAEERKKPGTAVADLENVTAMLFWARKMMPLERSYGTGGGSAPAAPAAPADAPIQDETAARAALGKADRFVQKHPDDTFLISVRYFEVAERYQGTRASLEAQRKSLDAYRKVMAVGLEASAGTTAAPAEPVAPAQPVGKPKAKAGPDASVVAPPVEPATATETLPVAANRPSASESLSSMMGKLNQEARARVRKSAPPPAGVGEPYRMPEGLAVMEGERPHEALAREGGAWELRVANEISTGRTGPCSGEGFVRTPQAMAALEGDDFAGKAPELRYRIEFPAAGTYYVWLRAAANPAVAAGAAVHCGLDGAPVETACGILDPQADNQWHWLGETESAKTGRARLVVAAAGEHTLNVWAAGPVKLDKLILAREEGFQPSDLGPAVTGFGAANVFGGAAAAATSKPADKPDAQQQAAEARAKAQQQAEEARAKAKEDLQKRIDAIKSGGGRGGNGGRGGWGGGGHGGWGGRGGGH